MLRSESLRGPTHSLPHDYVCPQAWRTAIPEALYPTTYIRDRARDFLSAEHAKPYFLMVPSPIRITPLRRPAAIGIFIGLPMSKLPTRSMPQRWGPRLRSGHGFSPRSSRCCSRLWLLCRDGTGDPRAIALTCGMVAMIDDAIGAIMACLSERPDCEDTVVIFMSDHGDYLGDYGLLLKARSSSKHNSCPADLVRSRVQRFNESKALASTIDIAATILERAGYDPTMACKAGVCSGASGSTGTHVDVG